MANPRFKENKFKRFIAKSVQPILRVFAKKQYVSLQYKYITGHKLDWNTLIRYTEKLQYLRLYYYPNTESVITATDRVGARVRVTSLGLESILIPTIGVYENVDTIDFETLPNKFVIKATHGSGLNFICLDKTKLDVPKLKKTLRRYLKTDYGFKTVEPHYSKIRPRLIIEQFVGEVNNPLIEYKIHVFNGKARYLYIVSNRGEDIRYDNLYINFTPFPESQFNHWKSSDKLPRKPDFYNLLVEYAEKLAHDLIFCRVDFFVVDKTIYFNEFTFTPAKGTLIFDNDKADYIIGEWLDISNAKRKKAS